MSSSTHILMFPYPAQGHVLPMLDLAHHLSLHGLALTILVTPKNLLTLEPLLSSHPSIKTLILPFPNYPSLPPEVENVKDIGSSGNIPIMNALSRLHGPIVQWFKAHPNPPKAIISDFFLGWTKHLANELNIPRIAFYSSGAFLTLVMNFIWKDVEKNKTLPAINFIDLPRSPLFSAKHLPGMFRMYKESDLEMEFLKDGIIANMSSYGHVFNSFDALEGEYLAHLRKSFGHSRIWAVGPLLGRVDLDPNFDPEVSTWLDHCPDGSVLYVCFGSQKLLKKSQMEALANGLEKSQARFVWVIKPITAQQEETGMSLHVPEGFEDRVSDRGLVIKGWAQQVRILSHRAVGGFLSHCGWNSVLEGILSGVTMLMWPMESDQFVNARLLEEDVGSVVQVCEGADSVPDSDDLAQTISKAMSGTMVQKLNAEIIRGKGLEAIGKEGSSWEDLQNLVHDLSQI